MRREITFGAPKSHSALLEEEKMNVGKHGKIYGDQVSVHKKHLCKFLFELSEDNRNVEYGSSICSEYSAVYSADNSSIIEAVRRDPPENHARVWDPVDTTLVILTLTCWIILLVFCFQKFVDVLAYHSIRNESQIDKNYRKYLHARVQIVKPSERRNAFVIENNQRKESNSSRRSELEKHDDDILFADCFDEVTVF